MTNKRTKKRRTGGSGACGACAAWWINERWSHSFCSRLTRIAPVGATTRAMAWFPVNIASLLPVSSTTTVPPRTRQCARICGKKKRFPRRRPSGRPPPPPHFASTILFFSLFFFLPTLLYFLLALGLAGASENKNKGTRPAPHAIVARVNAHADTENTRRRRHHCRRPPRRSRPWRTRHLARPHRVTHNRPPCRRPTAHRECRPW